MIRWQSVLCNGIVVDGRLRGQTTLEKALSNKEFVASIETVGIRAYDRGMDIKPFQQIGVRNAIGWTGTRAAFGSGSLTINPNSIDWTGFREAYNGAIGYTAVRRKASKSVVRKGRD